MEDKKTNDKTNILAYLTEFEVDYGTEELDQLLKDFQEGRIEIRKKVEGKFYKK